MKENGTRRIVRAPARPRRAATVLVVVWVSCCAVLVCDRVFLSGSGALSAALFYTSLSALLACALGAGRLLHSRSAPDSGHELAGILDSLPCFVAALDAEGMNDYTNQRLLDYVGKGSVEVAGHRWMETIHPEERESVRGEWLRCAAAGVAMDVNHRMLRHDGGYRWFHARVEPSFDGRGRVARWHAILTDIDERVRAEESLRERERQLTQMVDTIPAMLIINSPAGEVEYVNKPLVDLFGRGLESLRDSGWADLIHPEDAEALFARLRDAYASGESLDAQYRMLCADGSYRWMQCRKQPLMDGAGGVVCWYGVLTDIDDRKKAEQALRESERGLREMVDAIPAMLFVAEAGGEIEYANRPLLDFLGRGVEALRGRGWVSMVHPDDAQTQVSRWLDMVATGGSLDTEFRVRRVDGVYRWFHSRVQPLRDGAGGVIRWYGVITDDDDRRRMEEELRRSRERLTASMRLAALAELSASIAHEINQPLGALVTNCHACQGWLAGDPPNVGRARLVLDRVIRDGNAAADVVRKIRALFKETAPAKELLDVNEVVVETHRLVLEEFSRTKIEVELELGEGLAPAPADRVQVQQVLVNLMHNGAEAMEAVGDRPRLLTVRTRRDGADVVVEVSDRGVGLQDVRKVFEPFFTTKEGGMGVGLAICRSIVEAHGGRIWAENREPRGAAFTFTLPADTDGER